MVIYNLRCPRSAIDVSPLVRSHCPQYKLAAKTVPIVCPLSSPQPARTPAAALAVLAILALRARKGRPGRQHGEQAGPEKWSATVPPLLPTTARMPDTVEVVQQQPDATLPASYVTSMGVGAGASHIAALGAPQPAHLGAR